MAAVDGELHLLLDGVALFEDAVGTFKPDESKSPAVRDVDVRADALEQHGVRDAESVQIVLRHGAPLRPERLVVVPPADPAVGRSVPRLFADQFEDLRERRRPPEIEQRLLFGPGGQMEVRVGEAGKHRLTRQTKLAALRRRARADLLLRTDRGDSFSFYMQRVSPDECSSRPEGSSGDEQTVHGRPPYTKDSGVIIADTNSAAHAESMWRKGQS